MNAGGKRSIKPFRPERTTAAESTAVANSRRARTRSFRFTLFKSKCNIHLAFVIIDWYLAHDMALGAKLRCFGFFRLISSYRCRRKKRNEFDLMEWFRQERVDWNKLTFLALSHSALFFLRTIKKWSCYIKVDSCLACSTSVLSQQSTTLHCLQSTTVIPKKFRTCKNFVLLHSRAFVRYKFSYSEGSVTFTCIHAWFSYPTKISYFQPKVRNMRNQIAYESFCDYSIL